MLSVFNLNVLLFRSYVGEKLPVTVWSISDALTFLHVVISGRAKSLPAELTIVHWKRDNPIFTARQPPHLLSSNMEKAVNSMTPSTFLRRCAIRKRESTLSSQGPATGQRRQYWMSGSVLAALRMWIQVTRHRKRGQTILMPLRIRGHLLTGQILTDSGQGSRRRGPAWT